MMSYLSDAQEMSVYMCGDSAADNINFVKFLLLKYNDTSVEVDAELEYNEYYKKHKS